MSMKIDVSIWWVARRRICCENVFEGHNNFLKTYKTTHKKQTCSTKALNLTPHKQQKPLQNIQPKNLQSKLLSGTHALHDFIVRLKNI